MRLRVLLPHACLFDGDVDKVTADGVDGSRGFLPRHVDFVLPLKSGVLSCVKQDGGELFFAINQGVLIKKGIEVSVVTPKAVMAERIEDLPENVLQTFQKEDEHEKTSRKVVAQLETMLVREFIEFGR